MKKFKVFAILMYMLFFSSCSSIKEGFTNQKKNSSDEFLVEKKSPLVMPPDYGKLPIPNEKKNQYTNEEKSIKSLIITKEASSSNSDDQDKITNNVEKSLLEKIKKN
tara:strand:- start:180 stop:500 length:321 start_codon:yes stop_codon:yes gene_type:complete